MVDYADVARLASHAFWERLLENQLEAREAAREAAARLGLGERMAQTLAEEVSRLGVTQAQRSAESW